MDGGVRGPSDALHVTKSRAVIVHSGQRCMSPRGLVRGAALILEGGENATASSVKPDQCSCGSDRGSEEAALPALLRFPGGEQDRKVQVRGNSLFPLCVDVSCIFPCHAADDTGPRRSDVNG